MVKIKRTDDFIISSTIYNFLNPKNVYIPMDSENVFLHEIGDSVLMHEPIFTNGTIKISSPVSGKIVKKEVISNKCYLVIENDFEEKKYSNKGDRYKYKKNSYKDLLMYVNENNVYDYYNNENLNLDKYRNTNIIVNAVDDALTANNEFYFANNLISILDTLEIIRNTLKSNKIFLVIKNNDTTNINNIINIIGNYPFLELRLVSSDYPFLFNKYAKKIVKEYEIISLLSIIEIMKSINNHCELDSKYFNISGNACNKNGIYNIKVGTQFDEIVKEFKLFNTKKVKILVNGVLSNRVENNTSFILDKTIQSIFLMKDVSKSSEECINCGECAKHCPMKINPKYIMDHSNKKYSNLEKKKCIHCNLCSYVCPSKIDLSSFLGDDTNE